MLGILTKYMLNQSINRLIKTIPADIATTRITIANQDCSNYIWDKHTQIQLSNDQFFPVLFINSSRLSSLAKPGLGAPLSSYLEGELYKLIYR